VDYASSSMEPLDANGRHFCVVFSEFDKRKIKHVLARKVTVRLSV
jgi:hypothetical protein